MKEEKCIVMENAHINRSYYLMKIKAEYIAAHSQPGNFVMVAVSCTFDPLLKRPFGIFKAEPPFIWVYYQVVGRGTELMSGLREDDALLVLGPLGNSFPQVKDKNILFLAGGRGIAPIYSAVEDYADHDNRLFLIYGARSAGDLNLLDRIEDLPMAGTYLYTEDGSIGQKGMVTTNIKDIIADQGIDMTISCGPEAMFKSLAGELEGMGTENYVSLEAMMGCGFGICYSCPVKSRTGVYKKVCTDGPIFRLEEIEC